MSGAKLSDEQWEIVRHPADQHAVVLAVAGSGKSTTLIERMAYLFETRSVIPKEIIAVMFNKSAADEMAEKLQKRMGRRNAPQSVTYHRLGTLTLKALVESGIAPAWTFSASPNDAARFAMGVIKPFTDKLNVKYPRLAADAFLGFVDRVKGDLGDPDQVFEDGDWSAKQDWFPAAYRDYEAARKEAGLRFFSDLIYDPVMIVKDNPAAAARVANRYAHVIVDEYQDICESQQALIKAVAGTRARVMVVGDDDQTIYTWRGAKPSYILHDFKRDFVGAVTYRLSRTWRYGHNIACAANYVITNNKDRSDKLCISGPSTPKSHVHLVQGDAESIIKTLRPILAENKKLKLNDIAVLVRAYARSGKLQLELLKYGIPFRLEGGEKVAVLENRWVKMLVGWMGVGAKTIAAHPYVGEPDVGSIIQLKEVLSTAWLGGLEWEKHNLLCKTVLSKPVDGAGFSMFSNNHVEAYRKDLKAGIQLMRTVWCSTLAMGGLKGVSPYDFLFKIYNDFNMVERINKSYLRVEDAETNAMLVLSFLEYAKQFKGDVLDFLEHVADLRSFSDEAKKSVDAIHITSIHRSKGLEWNVVFMVGLVQGKFPLAAKTRESSLKAEQRLEDERRLFYVGMTRARYHLYLMAPLDNGNPDDLEATKNLDTPHVDPKDDGHLMIRLKGGNPVAPYSLTDTVDIHAIKDDGEKREKSVLPSQFLYEANIVFANTMSSFLDKGLTVNSVSPELYNAYAQAYGSKKRMGKIRS